MIAKSNADIHGRKKRREAGPGHVCICIERETREQHGCLLYTIYIYISA
jgi:hypothetical protein